MRHSILTATLALVLLAPAGVSAQQISNEHRQRGERILRQLHEDLREMYFDPTFAGVDLGARVATARSRIEQVQTTVQLFAVLADFLAGLGDSHTTFFPPGQVDSYDYGIRMLWVGSNCFIVGVREGSSAEAQGIRVGDALVKIDAFDLQRRSFGMISYVYNVLNPRPEIQVTVRSPEGEVRDVRIQAHITRGQPIIDPSDPNVFVRYLDQFQLSAHEQRQRFEVVDDDIMVWTMPSFRYGDEDVLDRMVRDARRHRAVVLDMRNNPGGAVATQLHLIGSLFDRRVKVATVLRRSRDDELWAEPASNPYLGPLVILVNSNSASSAEMVARVAQLEGRGVVVGDRTAGAVRTSLRRQHTVGFGRVWVYGASISVSDVLMSDGAPLENIGVVPDVPVLPIPTDIRDGRDPQMERALELAREMIATSVAEGDGS
jgi:carboxyl-terminal processing protease